MWEFPRLKLVAGRLDSIETRPSERSTLGKRICHTKVLF